MIWCQAPTDFLPPKTSSSSSSSSTTPGVVAKVVSGTLLSRNGQREKTLPHQVNLCLLPVAELEKNVVDGVWHLVLDLLTFLCIVLQNESTQHGKGFVEDEVVDG